MFAGNKIFEVMFKASEYGMNPPDYQGISSKTFLFWATTFDNILADITSEHHPDMFSTVEKWFKCLKIMINMYKLSQKQTASMNFTSPKDAI